MRGQGQAFMVVGRMEVIRSRNVASRIRFLPAARFGMTKSCPLEILLSSEDDKVDRASTHSHESAKE